MDEETKIALSELLSILLNSNTEVYSDGVVEHEHRLFDNVDKDRLNKLYDEIND